MYSAQWTLIRYMICKYFPRSGNHLFTFLVVSVEAQEFLIWMNAY
jgi:hypothetical protein